MQVHGMNGAVAAAMDGQPSRRSGLTQVAVAIMLAFALISAVMPFTASDASAGEIGVINTEGAALMVHPSDQSVIDWMHQGALVDVLYGPHEGMYEVRYYGMDGWVWAEYLDIGGATAAVGASGGGEVAAPAPAPEPERWIDVNRSTGAVSLMIGDSVQATYWASLGWDTSADGFYSTAVGTYYIYGFDYSNHYTPFADAYISHWIAFDPVRFNGFHSYSKDADGNILPNGAGLTGGCVALAPGDIDAVFAFAEMGMRVEVHF
ncbi:MAG TPA: L,D-transpeptidase family protein [Thermomicrobiales bacterium]|jgi:hypothetical protein|nr:L,D-transpeptidase family protein [Thermomicrobiales bacterium]